MTRVSDIRYFVSSALRNLWESKVTTIFTVVTLAVALGFMGAYIGVFIGVKSTLGAVSESFPLTVYLTDHITGSERAAVEATLKKDPAVESYAYTSKEKALADFKGSFKKESPLVDSLGSNPLPASYDVRLKADAQSAGVEALVKGLRPMPGVEDAQYMQDEAGRMMTVLKSLRTAGIILGLGVILGVVFISYSTLRLSVLAHKDEIEVVKLMGATRPFIMAPFLIEGVIQGLAAGGLALLLLHGLLRVLSGASATVLLTDSGAGLLPLWAWAGILASGAALGLAGGLIAFVRTLRM